MGAEKPKYRVLHELGAGGMGLVWRGILVGQAGFQRPIVIKQLKQAGDPGHVQLFVEEARRYALLDHENIGRIFDFDRVGGELCIILEHIDGWTLVDYLDRHRDERRTTDVDLSVFIASRVCRALQYVFERARIVHRDISPSNIMMTREGTVKLIDFGIAARSGTREGGLTGKPSYMAPEMVTEQRTDHRSDLFSLGAVLHELLSGERLFRAPNTAEVLEKVLAGTIPSLRRLRSDVPEGVEIIVRRALERDPARRYASAAEMGEACEHHLYDKGYGPTNLSLKRYLAGLFPEALEAPADESFPSLDAPLIPVFDRARTTTRSPRVGVDETGVTPVAPVFTRVVSARPRPAGGGTMGTTVRSARTMPIARSSPPPEAPKVAAPAKAARKSRPAARRTPRRRAAGGARRR